MELNLKQKIIIALVILLIIVGVGIYFLLENNNKVEYDINDFISSENSEANSGETIIVHVAGEVKKPGIIELPEGARIADAIEAAGEATKNANLEEVNLAYVLSDGQKIYIPNKNEKDISQNKEYITVGSGNNVIIQDNVTGEKNQKVNINDAKQEELEELPGIGPSIAKKIIEYREQNGKFTSIDELQEIKGIGESKYENIKEYVMVK